jgi:ankyrin repeat protein
MSNLLKSTLACKNYAIEVVKILIDRGANLNIQNKKGETALMLGMY